MLSKIAVIDEAIVLHTLRVRGFVTPDGFTASLGTFPADILAQLVADGQVRHIEKRDMYGLLPAGKQRQEELLDHYADDQVRSGIEAHYEDFLVVNTDFKQLCTDWQMRDGEANDHSDAAYEQGCIDRLATLNEAAQPLIDQLADALPRMARYNTRLAAAANHVAAGETKQFTGVMCESFHDIWMELHEDLIVLQRVNRVEEGSF